jgi:hypothetical protein
MNQRNDECPSNNIAVEKQLALTAIRNYASGLGRKQFFDDHELLELSEQRKAKVQRYFKQYKRSMTKHEQAEIERLLERDRSDLLPAYYRYCAADSEVAKKVSMDDVYKAWDTKDGIKKKFDTH